MKKLFNKKFALILGSTIILLLVLIIAIVFLTKENTKSFTRSGYIIASSKENSTKYYFDEGTNYKTNINSELVFTDASGEKVNVETDNFMHYTDGGIKFLKNGVIMDLESVNSTIVPYYNITNKSLLEYSNKSYYIETIDKTLSFNNLIGRISENKYIVAGVDIKLQLAGNDNVISGDYFELTFVEDGVIKVENQEVSYQTTAENSYVLVNDNIKIDLGSKKIYYNEEEKMSLTQMTIDGNENIEIIPTEEEKKDDGSANEGNNNQGNSNIDNTPNNGNENSKPNDGTGNEIGEGSGTGTGVNKTSASIELAEAEVGTNNIYAKFYINDPDKTIKGDLVVQIINTDTGKIAYRDMKDKGQKEFFIDMHSLNPNSNYVLSVSEETNGKYNTQYFQKLFRTDKLGISLQKKYLTTNSIAYEVVFEDDSLVKSANIKIKDAKLKDIEEYEKGLQIDRDNRVVVFEGLNYDTTYNLVLNSLNIDGIQYGETDYEMYVTTKTLKRTPSVSELTAKLDEDKNSFTLKIGNIIDEDKSITKYTYQIFESNKITIENRDNLIPIYTETKEDSREIKLPIGKNGIESGKDYRYNVIVEYFDNEKYVEYETISFSNEFILAGKPEVKFVQNEEETTYEKIVGTVTITDPNCTIPLKGRTCLPENTEKFAKNFTIRYERENGPSKIIENIEFKQSKNDPNVFEYKLEADHLEYNTTYYFELYGDVDYRDNNGLQEGIQIGEEFKGKTNAVDNLEVIWSERKDSEELFDLTAFIDTTNDKNEEAADALKYITFNLYANDVINDLENKEHSIKPIASIEIAEDENNKIKDTYYKKDIYIDKIFKSPDKETLDKETLKELSGGELKRFYTIEITDTFVDYEKEQEIPLLNKRTLYEVPAIIRLEDEKVIPEINATKILNEDLNKEIYGKEKDKKLNNTTIVGYNVNLKADLQGIKNYFETDAVKKLVFYVCDNNENANCKIEDAIAKEEIDLKENPELSTNFFLENANVATSKFTRGRNYVFKAKFLIDKNNDGTIDTVYPTEELKTEPQKTEKQSPIYQMYIFKTEQNKITYKYKFSDIDRALLQEKQEEKKVIFKYVIGDGEEQSYMIPESENILDGQYHDFVIEGLNNNSLYNISYYEQLLIYGSKDNKKISEKGFVFDGLHVIDDVEFEPYLDLSTNRLYILLHDNIDNSQINRISAIKIALNAENKNGEKVTYESIVATDFAMRETAFGGKYNGEKYKFISKYFSGLADFKGLETEVKITAYYDTGIINNDFDNIVPDEHKNGAYGEFILQESNEKDDNGIRYYNMNDAGGISIKAQNQTIPNGIYGYGKNTNINQLIISRRIKLSEANDKLNNTTFNRIYTLNYTNEGITTSDLNGESIIINNKELSTKEIKAKDNKNTFTFYSYVPSVKVDFSDKKVNSIDAIITATGLDLNDVKKENDGKYYYYVNLYEGEYAKDKTPIISDIEIPISSEESTKYTFENLEFSKDYYISVYAYMKSDEGKYTKRKLLDTEKQSYDWDVYEFSTSDFSDLSYNNNNNKYISYKAINNSENFEYGTKQLLFDYKTNLNKGDYQIKYTLLDGENKILETNWIETPKKDSSNSYNIYNIEEILPKDFVYGKNYIVEIYLKTDVYNIETSTLEKKVYLIHTANNTLDLLKEPTISIEVGNSTTDSITIDAIIITDESGVIIDPDEETPKDDKNDGKYCYQLIEISSGKIIKENCERTVNDNDFTSIIFDNELQSNTMYEFKVYGKMYINNNNDANKELTFNKSIFVSTLDDNNISLGDSYISDATSSTITLSFIGGANINSIKTLDYTLYDVNAGKNIDSVKGYSINKVGYNKDTNTYSIEIKPDVTVPSKFRLSVMYYNEENTPLLSNNKTYNR